MGLDISAYRNLQAYDVTLHGEDADRTSPYCNPAFPQHYEGLEKLDADLEYVSEERFSFRAGSYGGYNSWRNRLAELAGYAGAEAAWAQSSGPFWELIAFSDCEGCIGPVISAKLAADFAQFQDKADALRSEEDYFAELYDYWRKAFELAAQGGMVEFH